MDRNERRHDLPAAIPGLLLRIVLVGCLLGVVPAAASAAAPMPVRQGEGPRAVSAPAPYLVVENVGQFAPEVRFMFAQGNQRVWLTGDAIWLDAPDPAALRPGGLAARLAGRVAPAQRKASGAVLRFAFAGANPAAALEAFGRLEARVSYLIGNDESAWHRDVPAWSGVRYRELYPGVDLVLGTDATGTIPWRLEARAGADLSVVKLQVDGAAAAQGGGGGLRLDLGGREVVVEAPTWRLDDAETLLAGAVAAQEANAFALTPQVDAGAEPVASAAAPAAATDLIYSRVLGGAPTDGGEGIAVDAAGNAFITGATSSASFPGVAGHYDTSLGGPTDAFVVKLDPAAQILYATYLGGSGVDVGAGIAVANDVAYVTGSTDSTNFPGTAGTVGGMDAFVVSLSANGNSLGYSRLLGGSVGAESGAGIAVEGTDAYVVGSAGSYDLAGQGCGAVVLGTTDILVARLGGTGVPVYVKCLGGSFDDQGYGIAVASQVAYVTGETWSSDVIFPQPPLAGENDILVAAIGGDGTTRGVTFIGGSLGDQGSGLAASVNASGSGSLYIAGSTNSNNLALATARPPDRFDSDAAIVRVGVAPGGSGSIQLTPNYASYLGGSGDDLGRGMARDASQALFVTGATASADFPVTTGAYDTANPSGTDAFVARLDLSLAGSNKTTYATFLGSAGEDAGEGIATDGGGNAFVTGSTTGQGFPVTVGSAPVANDQVFAAKLRVAGPAAPLLRIAASYPNVVLTWDAASGASRYEAFRSSLPYFAAGDASSTLLPNPTTSPYTDPNVLGQEGGLFYVVRSVSAAPELFSDSSNRVGKFTYTLVKGN